MIFRRFIIILTFVSITSLAGASMLYVGNKYIPDEVTIYSKEVSNNIDNNTYIPELQVAEITNEEENITENIVETVENPVQITNTQVVNEEIITDVVIPVTNTYIEETQPVIETANVEIEVVNNDVEINQGVIEVKPTPVITEPQNDCSTGNHSLDVGNSGVWFNTKDEAIASYNNLQKMYSDKLRNKEITKDEYYNNCPYGYEVWSCMYCNKWTINYYYH